MPETPRTSIANPPAADLNRRAILGRLRATLAQADLRFPPLDPPQLTGATRMAVTSAPGGAPELAARFAAELEAMHGTCEFVGSPAEARLALINRLLDWRNEDEAGAKGMRIKTGQERMVLGWEDEALPVEHVADSLADMGMRLVVPGSLTDKESREAMRHIRYGLTGAEAAFAATGSLLLASGLKTPRTASLLPLHHIALVPLTRLYANLETWLAEMRMGNLDTWVRSKPNLTLVTGPSKSADIEMILTLGVHGPKFLHVILFDDGVQDDESHDAFWRYIPGKPPAPAEPPRAAQDMDEGLLPSAYSSSEPQRAYDSPEARTLDIAADTDRHPPTADPNKTDES